MGGQQAEEERSTRTSIHVPTCTSGFGPLLAVVITGVANDGVNVIGAPLGSVLDQERRALDTVVDSAAIRPAAASLGRMWTQAPIKAKSVAR